MLWYKEESFLYRKFVVLFIILGIIFIFMILKYEIKTFYTIYAVVTDENVITTIVPIDILPLVLKEEKVTIENKNYHYQVLELNEELLTEGSSFFKEIKLKIVLPKEYSVIHNTFSLQIKTEEKSILRILESCYKGE